MSLVLVAWGLSAYSSELPDGLEAVALQLGVEEHEPVFGFSLEEVLSLDWFARLLGVLVAGLCGWGVARLRRGAGGNGAKSPAEGAHG